MSASVVPSLSPPRPAAARTLNVFVVEDSPTIRQNLVDTLEELAPVRVTGTADSAAAAIDALAKAGAPFDLAVVDMLLRGGSGIDVLEALRRGRSSLRRVVLSNYASPALRERCLALGAERVFDKSCDIEALVDYCRALAEAEA